MNIFHSNLDPVPKAQTPKHQALSSKPSGSVVAQRTLEIERQLAVSCANTLISH